LTKGKNNTGSCAIWKNYHS